MRFLRAAALLYTSHVSGSAREEHIMKKRLGPSDRLYPMPCPLVVGGTSGESDLLAVAWIGIAAGTPPSVSMALRDSRRTLELIREAGEFTVNIPPVRLAAEVDYCGITSGRSTDKWADTGLTPLPGAVLSTPIVAECPYNMECRVTAMHEIGHYTLVVGEVVETHADEHVLDETGEKVDVGLLDPLVYIAGSREYRGLGPVVAQAFSVGRTVRPRGSE
jgi:flavin reductase (DIM6/NTAB) family NADH-FMN oxidoreductase RutF